MESMRNWCENLTTFMSGKPKREWEHRGCKPYWCLVLAINWYRKLFPVLIIQRYNWDYFCPQNNPTYYNYAMKKWQSLEQHHQLTQSRNFVALLAINQNQPAEALKVLGDVDIHFSAVFVRLLALTKLERFEEIFNILNENFLQENQKYSKSKIPGELVCSLLCFYNSLMTWDSTTFLNFRFCS